MTATLAGGPGAAVPPRAGRRELAGLAVAMVVPVAVFLGHASRYGHWLVDDALISLAYARTFNQGGGIAQQLGAAPVEGFSNPTWTLLLTLLDRAGLLAAGRVWWGVDDYVVVFRLLAVVLFVATLAVVHRGARSLLSVPYAAVSVLVTGLLLAVSPSYVAWSVSGLENPLYGLVVAAIAAALVRGLATGTLLSLRVLAVSSTLAVVAGATRPDGVVFAAAYPLTVLAVVRRRTLARSLRQVVLSALVFGVPTAGLLLLRHHLFGLWVPNTALAKRQQLPTRAQALEKVEDLLSAVTPAALLVGALLVLATVVIAVLRRSVPGRGRFWPAALGLLVPLTLAVAAFVLLKRDWMSLWRFSTPAVVTASALVGLSIAVLARDVPSRAGRAVVALLAALLLTLSTVPSVDRARAFAESPTWPGCFVTERYGRTFNLYADRLGVADGSVLAPDLGGLLLTSRLRVTDLAGLTDRKIADFRYRRDSAGLRDYVLSDLRPTFIATHGPWVAGLLKDRRFRRDYLVIVDGEDFVRRDAVRDPDRLARLRQEMLPLAGSWSRMSEQRPRASCGALEPGQLPAPSR